MSHSSKDGRRGGGHRNTQGKEVWSKRCPRVSMWSVDDPDYKRVSARYVRRIARKLIREYQAGDDDMIAFGVG